jgi:hypothetical protein
MRITNVVVIVIGERCRAYVFVRLPFDVPRSSVVVGLLGSEMDFCEFDNDFQFLLSVIKEAPFIPVFCFC